MLLSIHSGQVSAKCLQLQKYATLLQCVSTACFVLQVLSRSTSGAGLAARGVGSPTVGDGPGYRQLWAQVRHRVQIAADSECLVEDVSRAEQPASVKLGCWRSVLLVVA
jgi:hypothetical protein